MAERIVWGLDIGQTAIRAIKVQALDGGSAVIADAFFLSLDSGPDDSLYLEKVESALFEFSRDNINSGNTPVVLSVRGVSSLFRLFNIAAVTGSRLHEIITYEARQLIPYPLEEVVWDYQTLDIDDNTGELQVALFCVHKDIIDELLEMTDRLKLEVIDVQVAPLALVNFCKYDFYNEGRILLLDAGARSTDFVIFDQNVFWVRSIPNCGNDFVKALMDKFHLEYPAAAALMSGVANPKQNVQIFETIAPLFQNLASEVQRSLGFYRSTKRDATVSEMQLGGNTFRLPGVDQLMADTLAYSTRSFDLPHRLGLAATVSEQMLYEHRQVYGVAAGLALQGLGLAKYSCSLLPQNRKIARIITSKEIYGWIIAAVVVLMVVIQMISNINRRPIYENHLREIRDILATSRDRYDHYVAMFEQFKPAQMVNQQLADMARGRGAAFTAQQELHRAIREFNVSQQKSLFKESLNNVTLREYERRAREDVISYPPSEAEYKRLREEKENNSRRSGGFREDYISISNLKGADSIREDMNANLELQILRYMMTKHQRRNRVFINNENYTIGIAEKKIAADQSVAWNLQTTGNINQTPIAGRTKSTWQQQSAANDEFESDEADNNARTIVVIEINGFVVDAGSIGGAVNADTATRLKDYLFRLQKQGFYLLDSPDIESGFMLVRSVNQNQIKLPVIYSPLPKQISDDEIGEMSNLKRDEVLQWENASETVHSFRARLLYEPVIPALNSKTFTATLTDARRKVRAVMASDTANLPAAGTSSAPKPEVVDEPVNTNDDDMVNLLGDEKSGR